MATDRRSFALLALLLVSTFIFFLMRGPWRAFHGRGADFAAPYVSTLKFARGQNPYTSTGFIEYWHASGAASSQVTNESGQRPIYPPSAFVILWPLSMLSWPAALGAFETVSIGLVLGLVVYLARPLDVRAKLLFAAYALMLAPLSAGLGVANLSIPALSLCLLAVLLAGDGRELLAGTVLAISICLKPTTGLPGLVYLLFCRRWRACGYALGLSAIVSGVALWRMHYLQWQADYHSNLNYLFSPVGAASYKAGGRFDLLNLQVPLYGLTRNGFAADILTWALVLGLGVWWTTFILRQPALVFRLESAAVVLLLGLLPVYQRNYNAGFVLLPLLWAFMNTEKRAAKAILILGVAFVVPTEAFLRNTLAHLPSGRLWDGVVMPHVSWALVAYIVILLCAMRSTLSSPSPFAPDPPPPVAH